ncbi:hypothetical protein ACTJLC_22705 [Paraburkholderia sp. 22099]|uniref:Cytochrome C oxidase subunit I n=1 Tax=Paraburkholderia terricola TaxID=169427 RepID=A0ABU1LY28_9BURK|nr:hypothetical protein [Paraburkholderia terricola]MDR6411655.1 hypothetical protein [Paraburkholderia terricola]MDR6484062.1 hypothetical protein [Paraburkholderia terricola]MDR6493918.1 hypothetical protein [Paraburkholderia terricola]
MTDDMTPRLSREPPQVPHPAMRHMLIGLLLAPFAWLAQMVTTEALAAQSCYPFDRPLSAPLVVWMRPALFTVSALCLAAGVFGTLTAWRTMRRIGPMQWGALSGKRRTRAELDWFLSRIAAMCSALFLFALIATDVALAIVSPCRGW